jgi:hypothetical protein
MAGAALALHELRSRAGLGAHSGGELAQHAHGYLGATTLAVELLAAVVAAHFLVRVAGARLPEEGRQYTPHAMVRVWCPASIALLLVCFGQELAENLAATGSLADPGVLLGHGGWSAIPLGILLGGGVALLARGADAAITLAARREGPARVGSEAGARPALAGGHPRPHEPLADPAAGRAPPSVAYAT